MINVLYLPLDDRPCNEHFPYLLPRSDYNIIPLPKNLLGNKKEPAIFENVKKFLLDNYKICDILIISLDTLIYGGLIPSRLHHLESFELIERFNLLLQIKNKKPSIKIYGFSTIMRCPNTNYDSEEPPYWAEYGKKIFRYGQLKDLFLQNSLNKENEIEFNELKKEIPSEALKNFEDRRKTNLDVTKEIILINKKSNLFNFYCLPQDDSNPLGWTAIDQREIKSLLARFECENIKIYPGADEVGMVLLSRAINEESQIHPSVFVKYAKQGNEKIIPPYEDRPIKITIDSQLSVSNVKVTNNENDADIIICTCIGEYNYSEFITYVKKMKSLGKIVGIVDTYLPSGSDLNLINELKNNDMLLKIDGYASWNTASNTFGTVLAETILLYLEKDVIGNKKFLIHRYVDDYVYCTSVRTWTDINAALARGYCEAKLDGVTGTCTKMCHDELIRFINTNIPEVAENIVDINVSSPWNRSFEMKFIIEYKEEIL